MERYRIYVENKPVASIRAMTARIALILAERAGLFDAPADAESFGDNYMYHAIVMPDGWNVSVHLTQ